MELSANNRSFTITTCNKTEMNKLQINVITIVPAVRATDNVVSTELLCEPHPLIR